MIKLFTDGGCYNNPGMMAIACSIVKDNVLVSSSCTTCGNGTNNIAEYRAVLYGLEEVAKKYGYDIELEVYSDSRLVIFQIRGIWRINMTHLESLCHKVKIEAKKFKKITFSWTERSNEFIEATDKLIKEKLNGPN